MNNIKVIVVDDSYFMREAISKILKSGGLDVVDTAKDGKEAFEKAMIHKPDVITMDIEMPVMNGIESLNLIMKHCPTPVIMLSTLTTEGADKTVDALSAGAIDFITKKAAFKEMDGLKEELITKVIQAGSNTDIKNSFNRRRILRQQQLASKETDVQKPPLQTYKRPDAIDNLPAYQILSRKRPVSAEIRAITIGISTGGPVALMSFLKDIPKEIPVPILIAQHMPPLFTNSLATRLNSACKLTVKEAQNDERILPGYAYIAPGGLQMSLNKNMRIIVNDEKVDSLYKPCVDHLVSSVTNVFSKQVVGIIMTGMGNDGSRGLKELSNAGGYVIAQEPESCVVAGMPRSVIDSGIANEIVSLKNIAESISSLFGLQAENN